MIEFNSVIKGNFFIKNITNFIDNKEINDFITNTYSHNLKDTDIITTNNYFFKSLCLKKEDEIILFIKANRDYSNIRIEYKSTDNKTTIYKEITFNDNKITYIDFNVTKNGLAIYGNLLLTKSIRKYFNDILYYENISANSISDFEDNYINKITDTEMYINDNQAICMLHQIDSKLIIKYLYTDNFTPVSFRNNSKFKINTYMKEITEEEYLNYLSVINKRNTLKMKK